MLRLEDCISTESFNGAVTVVAITTPSGAVFTAQSMSPGIARDMALMLAQEATDPIVIEDDTPQGD